MNKPVRVFISYARKDEVFANAMVKYFEQNDIHCFIDKRDIKPGTKYSEEIINAIEESDIVILILTKESNNSENVRNEIDNASNLKKKIIVFRIENIALSRSLQFYLATSQWFDAFSYRGEQYFEQLTGYVKGLPIPPFSTKIIQKKKISLLFLQMYLILTVMIFFLFGIPVLRDYSAVNTRNSRGIRLIDAVKMAGLSDIESRKWKKVYNIAPPVELYENAKREIFVSGVTLGVTLENHREYLRTALKKGVKIRLLLLDPSSPDTVIVGNINNRFQNFASSMQNSLAIIANDTEMFHNKNVEVRFASNIPPLVGMLIDGDITAEGRPMDTNGIVRVNPYFKSPVHNDWYLQFTRSNGEYDAFVDFAAEFRQYWKAAHLYKKGNSQ